MPRAISPSKSRRIVVAASVAAPISCVFAFLADPENHRRLAGRRFDLVGLEPGERLLGGEIVIRGPLRIRRRADTHVSWIHEPHLIAGVAQLGRRTRAVVRWDLDHHSPGHTRVALTADPWTLSRTDRLLLRLGGARWIRTVFAETIERLAVHVVGSATAVAA